MSFYPPRPTPAAPMPEQDPDPPTSDPVRPPGWFRFSAPPYDGPPAENHDGRVFRNLSAVSGRGAAQVLRWMLTRRRGPWEKRIEIETRPAPPRVIPRDGLRVTFVNHATVLIQTGGFNLLTDPHWSERCSPFTSFGPRRVHVPGIGLDDLPEIHAVLLSHNHYDHCDIPTLRRLARDHSPRVFTGLGNSRLLAAHGIMNSTDMNWWDSAGLESEVGGRIEVTFVPAQHWSGRGLSDRAATLWGGFVLRCPAGVVFFAGDTGDGGHFEMIRDRFGPPRLALIPIGAYLPRWFMRPVHLSPEEAADAHLRLGAERSVAIHHGTFRLADDGREQAALELVRACSRRGISEEDFRVLAPGAGWDVPGPSADGVA